ncbi:hypothetical protein [Endozoicomonas sp. ALB032]|uniref:hypothetical protein n=1 Tax=Endozoicomonas sp. ALB032 TaxID=3403082 RepID=UPI003BB58662
MDKPSCSSSSSPYYGAQEPYIVDRPDESKYPDDSKCFGMKIDAKTTKVKKRKVTEQDRQKYIEERKIKNRVAAALSRGKKEKYLEGLEKEVKTLTQELKEKNQKIQLLSCELEEKHKKINSLEEELKKTREEKEYFKNNLFTSAKNK